MKKFLLWSLLILNIITLIQLIFLSTFDEMRNHLTNGGYEIARPVHYATFTSVSIVLCSFFIFHALFRKDDKPV